MDSLFTTKVPRQSTVEKIVLQQIALIQSNIYKQINYFRPLPYTLHKN